ncbi:MAG TPA: hypothetical protein VGO89_08430, partial [Streptomyces sp.]|nr:hypothetical protein [Streptomyces sp.]
RDLSPEHQQWVDAERSKANAQLALATVRRQVARADARASLELLAAERVRSEFEEFLPAASSAPALDASTVTALPVNRIPRTSTDDAMTSRAHDVSVRPDTSGYPESTTPDQATDTTNIRQKNGKRPSIAKEVRRVVADGLTDVETIAHAVAHRVGRDADDPTYTETVKHYVREARKDQDKDSAAQNQGLYL